jgi:energy-coupling factor transport system ATP-binding protein
MITVENVTHHYSSLSSGEAPALRDISTAIAPGEFVSILGHNGSGKSTFVKLLNALIIPDSGDVFIETMNTRNEKDIWNIRSKVGMVFQNPDSQLVATTVEEELAFGPENLGIPREQIISRIDEALGIVGLEQFRTSPPHMLSGGQKQKVAIASVLTMHPRYLILDEPTAMLDPVGQAEVMGTLKSLNEVEGITVILVTQNMIEAALSRRVIVMKAGEIMLDTTPREVFGDVKRLEALHLEAPPMARLVHRLEKKGIALPGGILTVDEMADALARVLGSA